MLPPKSVIDIGTTDEGLIVQADIVIVGAGMVAVCYGRLKTSTVKNYYY